MICLMMCGTFLWKIFMYFCKLLTNFKTSLTLIILTCLVPYNIAAIGNQGVTQILSHDDQHYLVWDQVGQMGASTSYIHVMLPFKVSTLLEHGELLLTNLNSFNDFKTANFTQITIVKQYKEIAANSKRRLLKAISKIKTIDNILPKVHETIRYGKDLDDDFSWSETNSKSDFEKVPNKVPNLVPNQFLVPNSGTDPEPESTLFRTKRAWFIGPAIIAAIAPFTALTLVATSKMIADSVINAKRKQIESTLLSPAEIHLFILNKVIKADNEAARDLIDTVIEAYKVLPIQYQESFDPVLFEIPIAKFNSEDITTVKIVIIKRHIKQLADIKADVQNRTLLIQQSHFTTLGNPKRFIREVMEQTDSHLITFIAFLQGISFSDTDDIHEYSKELADMTKDHFIPVTDILSRDKRFIDLAGLATGVVGTFMGLYNAVEIQTISKRVSSLQGTQNLLVHLANKQQVQLDTITEDVTLLSSTFSDYISNNPPLFYAKLNDYIMEFEARVQQLENVAQQLQHRRLAVDWLDEEQLAGFHNSVTKFAADKDYTLLTSQISDYFQLEVSYYRNGSDIVALVHVPCILTPSLLSIYKYVPFPIPLPPTKTPHSSLSIREALSVSRLHPDDPLPELNFKTAPAPGSEALFLKVDSDLIAIDGQQNFRLLSQSDLASCIQRNHFYLCEQQHVLRTNLTQTCLGSLYLKRPSGVRENCRFDRRPLRERVYQTSSNEYLVYSPVSFTTRVSCTNGSSFTADFGQTTRLTVPDGCKIQLNSHTLRVDERFHLPLQPQIYEWNWSPMDLPSDLLDRSLHIDFNLQTIAQSLSSLRNRSTDPAIVPDLVENHLSSFSSPWGLILKILAVLGVLTPAAVIAWYFYRRHRRRTRPHRLQHVVYNCPDDEIAIRVPRHHGPPNFAPPPPPPACPYDPYDL